MRILTHGRKVKLTILFRRSFGRAPSASPWDSREPLREELFSVERLEVHARSLAVAQSVTPKPTKGRPLVRRLRDNGAVLLDAYRKVSQGIDEGRAITPAGEWLVDNYHIVERQIRAIHSDLPPRHSKLEERLNEVALRRTLSRARSKRHRRFETKSLAERSVSRYDEAIREPGLDG